MIQAEEGDIYNVINEYIEHDIYGAIIWLEEDLPSRGLLSSLDSSSSNPTLSSDSEAQKVTRVQNVVISTNLLGEFNLFLLRSPQKKQRSYPGIVKGTFKTFKKGVLRIQFRENPLKSGNLELLEWGNYLSLKSKCSAYQQLEKSTDMSLDSSIGPFDPLSEQGFIPEDTLTIESPPKSDLTKKKLTVFVKDYGNSLNNLELAKKIIGHEDYVRIADAILTAGKQNPPIFLPYDLKPENILLSNTTGQNFFKCIDFSSCGITPVYLSDSIHPRLGVNKSWAHMVLLSPQNQHMVHDQIRKLSYEEATLHVVTDTIIATFICLMSARLIPDKSTLLNEDFVESLKQRLAPELSQIPFYFQPSSNDPITFKLRSMLEKHTSQIDTFIPDDFNWYSLLNACYKT